LLIMGWAVPAAGVEGAALASVMVRGGGFLLGLVIALRRGLLRISAPDWRALPTIIRIGAPLSLAGVLLSVIYMWLTRFTSRFGTAALAALAWAIRWRARVHRDQRLRARRRRARRPEPRGGAGGAGAGSGAAHRELLPHGHRDHRDRLSAHPGRLVSLFTRDSQVIADGVLYLRVIAFAQIGQSFELILEGGTGRRGLYILAAGREHDPDRVADSPCRLVVAPVRAARDLAALSVTAISRGIAMVLFWKGGRWRTVRV